VIASVKYVLQENIKNFYRTFSIAKYEFLSEMRDDKLGVFWNFASPIISVFTYWFAFGYIFNRQSVDNIPFIIWMLAGMLAWLFLSPCITGGCRAVFNKLYVITKMKFPVSILPLTVVLKQFFYTLFFFVIVVIMFALFGYYPQWEWFGLIYYFLAAIIFSCSLSMLTSVLTMIARDVHKFISSIIRLLLYLTPIFWEISMVPEWMQKVLMCNPMYYIVQGFRDCFFYHQGIGAYTWSMAWFWGITLVLFLSGSFMMNKFKTKFIDMI